MSKGPIEIHISGTSGSGKSHLGEHLARTHGLYVIDMDEFFQPDDGRWERLEQLRQAWEVNDRGEDEYRTYRNTWLDMKTERFEHYRRQAPKNTMIIIWVGLTDHAFGDANSFYEIERVQHKYYLHVSSAALCRQFYSRLVAGGDETDWMTIPSSVTIVAWESATQIIHRKHGYRVLSYDGIEREVIEITKKSKN